jgi:hypothetical protein
VNTVIDSMSACFVEISIALVAGRVLARAADCIGFLNGAHGATRPTNLPRFRQAHRT